MAFDLMYVAGENRNRVAVVMEYVAGTGGAAHPVLIVPFRATLHRLAKPRASYTILYAEPRLDLGGTSAEGRCDVRAENVRLHDSETTFNAYFPLGVAQLEHIEAFRAGGDLKARCELRFIIALSIDLNVDGAGDVQPFVMGHETTSLSLEFTIPHSTWVNNVLTRFGFGRMQLLEVPVPLAHAPEVFAGAIEELKQARSYYVQADYESVMSHCRKSLESVLNVLTPDLSGLENPGFSRKLARAIEQHLGQQLSESKRASLHDVATAVWNLTSISTHHVGGIEYFDRADAEATMLHCSTLLAYIGRAIGRKEASEK